jgi:hypothetical protein
MDIYLCGGKKAYKWRLLQNSQIKSCMKIITKKINFPFVLISEKAKINREFEPNHFTAKLAVHNLEKIIAQKFNRIK